MNDTEKERIERKFTALDAILSAIVVALKWLLEEYPVPEGKHEKEAIKEVRQNLEKAQSTLRNYINSTFPMELNNE